MPGMFPKGQAQPFLLQALPYFLLVLRRDEGLFLQLKQQGSIHLLQWVNATLRKWARMRR